MIQAERGPLKHPGTSYGHSVQSIPLQVYLPPTENPQVLLMGAIHGDESISSVLLSECLRGLNPDQLQAAVILAANPDGVLLGTRCNAQGVDLNRNYPTQNWSSNPVYYRNKPGGPQDIALSPGTAPGSEPETQALMSLILKLQPALIVSIHGFLGCIDDPDSSAIALDISLRSKMDLVPDVGYATPGSFGSWCSEKAIPIITYELPSAGMLELREYHSPIFHDLMTGHYDGLLRK